MLKKMPIKITETQITLGLKAATVLVAATALFSQDLTMLFSDAMQSETTSHLLAIPFLLAYLLYRKRKMLRATIPIKNENKPKETRHLPIIVGTSTHNCNSALLARLLHFYSLGISYVSLTDIRSRFDPYSF